MKKNQNKVKNRHSRSLLQQVLLLW